MLLKTSFYTNKKVEALINNDLVDKYNFNNFHRLPVLKKIKLKISISDMLKQIENIPDLEKDEHILKIKIFILFYLFFSSKPLIKNNSLTSIKVSRKPESIVENLIFDITITKKSQLYSFLFFFFIENFQKIKNKNLFTLDKIVNYSTITKLKINLPLKNIVSIKDAFFYTPFNLNIKDFFFSVCFVISNLGSLKNKNLIKSLPFFWILS